jgi:hypothetical protein
MKVTLKTRKDRFGTEVATSLTLAVEKDKPYNQTRLLERLAEAFNASYESITIRGAVVKVVRNL